VIDACGTIRPPNVDLISRTRSRSGTGARCASSLCVPYFLKKSGPPEDDYYWPTLPGLVASSMTEWVSRALEDTVNFLRSRIRSDFDSIEYALSDLRNHAPDLEKADMQRARQLIEIANLSRQTIAQGDDLKFTMPEHAEKIAQWNGFDDLLEYELARQARELAAANPAPRDAEKPDADTFETVFTTYRIVRQIGEGGIGIVFEVIDEKDKRHALKLLKPGGATDQRKRFENEMHLCFGISHGNIVRVTDFGFITRNGARVPFYVMKLYPATLRTRLKTGIDPGAAVTLFRQLVDGLVFAHENGTWHRDLKPENILVDDAGIAVIADFGIAKIHEDLQATALKTEPGDRTGSWAYAAPEQRKKHPESSDRSDVFTLGLILNEMFTGSVPHGTGYKTIAAVAKQFAALDSLVERMIKQDPQDRPTCGV
jgi:hypothetical protein